MRSVLKEGCFYPIASMIAFFTDFNSISLSDCVGISDQAIADAVAGNRYKYEKTLSVFPHR